MTKVTIKKKPDIIELDRNGSKVKYLASDWLMGICGSCGNEFLVKTNMGDMTCPHGCGASNIKWVWCTPKVIFVQEHEPMIIKNGQLK